MRCPSHSLGSAGMGRSLRESRATKEFVCLILFLCVTFYGFCNLDREEQVFRSPISEKFDNLISNWTNCVQPQMNLHRDQPKKLWDYFPANVKLCRKVFKREIKLNGLSNSDETKYIVFPKNLTKNITHVTLGIGKDTGAEVQLKKRMQEKVKFFGADPIIEVNEKLFKQIGSFFPFAVGAEAGMSTASVLIGENYVDKTVVHIDFIYFLKNVLRKTFIHNLWMDNEGAEYDLFPIFFKGGDLDKNGITICQINMEIHAPNDEKLHKIHDFLFKIVEEKRYAVLDSFNIFHMRLYLLNVENEECINNY